MAWNYNPESIVANLQMAVQKGKNAVKTAGELGEMVRAVAQQGAPANAAGRQWGAEAPAASSQPVMPTHVEEKTKEASNWYGQIAPSAADNPLLSGSVWGKAEAETETPSGVDVHGNPLSPPSSGWGAVGTPAYNFTTGGLGGEAGNGAVAYDPVSGGLGGSSYGSVGQKVDLYGNVINTYGGRDFVEHMGQTYELLPDGSRIAVDMNYQRVASTSATDGFLGVSMAELYGNANPTTDSANTLYGSSSGLYGYSPASPEPSGGIHGVSTSGVDFYGNPVGGTPAWGNSTSGNGFCPYTGGVGQNSTSSSSGWNWLTGGMGDSNNSSGSSWCPMTGGMGGNKGNNDGSGGNWW